MNAGGIGNDWPNAIKERYKKWVTEIDLKAVNHKSHRYVYNFHKQLKRYGINHFFFTCYEPWLDIGHRLDWDGYYLEPYDRNYTYYNWCQQNGFKTVRPDSYHFGPDAHAAWADFLHKNMVKDMLTRN